MVKEISLIGQPERKMQQKTERSVSKEERYDSLQSLSRLVEDDLRTEIETARRVSLPSLDVNRLSSELKPGLWRRNSSLVEYMQELTTKRNGMIQRLIPDIESENCPDTDRKVSGATFTNGEVAEDAKDVVSSEDCSLRNDSTVDSSKNELSSICCKGNSKVFGDDNSFGVDETVKALQERIAKFEEIKNASRSIHADDFQQFLGARYLEMYQKRTKRINEEKDLFQTSMFQLKDGKVTTQNERHYESFQGRKSRNLNAKLLSMARQRQLQNERSSCKQLKLTLPPLLKGTENERRDSLDRTKSILELNAKYGQGFVPIHNDLMVRSCDRSHTKGIPHHAEKRALKRYHESREIDSILTELRRLSSTVQKSEQENFVHKLEEDI